VEIASAVNVSTEAELGKIAGTEDDIQVHEKEAMLTDPAEVEYFVGKDGSRFFSGSDRNSTWAIQI